MSSPTRQAPVRAQQALHSSPTRANGWGSWNVPTRQIKKPHASDDTGAPYCRTDKDEGRHSPRRCSWRASAAGRPLPLTKNIPNTKKHSPRRCSWRASAAGRPLPLPAGQPPLRTRLPPPPLHAHPHPCNGGRRNCLIVCVFVVCVCSVFVCVYACAWMLESDRAACLQ